LLHPDLSADFPPIRSLSASPHNLPVQLTSFVGREQELRDLHQLLLDDEMRLITLTGAAGTGKTRLALRVAEEAIAEFPGGVYFVALAPVIDAGLLASTIGEAIGVREVPGQPFLRTIIDALQAKSVLLVLDAFEHAMPQSREVSQMLSSCVSLKMVVTCREVVHLAGEHVFVVAPMEVPDAQRSLAAEDARTYDAVRLFIERARAVKPGFALTSQNAPAIGTICAQLDGLPLAIELAAARVQLLPPDAVIELRPLMMSGLTALPDRRHQTLSGAIDWSYGLLKPWEQRLFRRLAVFSVGFTLEAAEAMCVGDPELDGKVLDGIASFIDKSLLRQAEERTPELR
jgi:non-specific serine/threonine protein kinase